MEANTIDLHITTGIIELADLLKQVPIKDFRDVLYRLAAHYEATGPEGSPRQRYANALVDALAIINEDEF